MGTGSDGRRLLLTILRLLGCGSIALSPPLRGAEAVPGATPIVDPIRRNLENRARLEPDLPVMGRPDEYVGSSGCRECHAEEFATWQKTYHRTMTQTAEPGNVLGRFDGTTIQSGGLAYRVGRDGDAYWAEMPDPDVMMYIVQGGKKLGWDEVPRVRLPVVMTTGSHHYQTYWVASPRYDRLLQTLPLVYLIADQRWIPREDAFLKGPHDTDRMITQWNHHCIRCHATGGNPGLQDATGQLRSEVGELGISCEACHGPGLEHVRRHAASGPRTEPSRPSKDPDPTIVNPERLDARRSSQVCGFCHGIHMLKEEFALDFARHGPLFRPGDDLGEKRYLIQHPRVEPTPARVEELRKNPGFFAERWWDDGTILAGGREHAALTASPCHTRGKLSCLSCHRMHGSDPNDQLRRGMEGPGACTSCHGEPKYTTEVERHTFHKPTSTGSDCLNCHMPHTTYALLTAIRSHQIQSPQVRSSARFGVPNACNLCHLDRTLAWTDEHLQRWYRQAPVALTAEQRDVSAALLWLLKGNAAQRIVTAWHVGWKPAQEASGADWLAPFQAELLADSYGVVRYVAGHRMQTLPGFEGFRPDFLASAEARRDQVATARARWRELHPAPSRRGEAVLIGADGEVQWSRLAKLVAEQDTRPMTVSE